MFQKTVARCEMLTPKRGKVERYGNLVDCSIVLTAH